MTTKKYFETIRYLETEAEMSSKFLDPIKAHVARLNKDLWTAEGVLVATEKSLSVVTAQRDELRRQLAEAEQRGFNRACEMVASVPVNEVRGEK